MASARYGRQMVLSGWGPTGQARVAAARVEWGRDGLESEVCLLYLAGAGVGQLVVPEAWVLPCRSLNPEVRVQAGPNDGRVRVDGEELAASGPGDPVGDGAAWADAILRRILP
jgi:hypothetical protein